MAGSWVSRLVALAGLAVFLYSLTHPWIRLRSGPLVADYRPWELLSQFAQGKGDLLAKLLDLGKQVPGGQAFILAFALHASLLTVALILAALSIVGNSAGSYVAKAAFTVLSLALLLVAVEQSPAISGELRSGALLALGSAFVYAASAAIARALK